MNYWPKYSLDMQPFDQQPRRPVAELALHLWYARIASKNEYCIPWAVMGKSPSQKVPILSFFGHHAQ